MKLAVDQAFDWICVGSGTSGLAAAIFGHDRGLKTLVLEKAAKIGGTTAQGGGLLYVPMNHLMAAAGIADSREEALEYLQFLGARTTPPITKTRSSITSPGRSRISRTRPVCVSASAR